MQLLIHASDTCFWRQSPYLWIEICRATDSAAMELEGRFIIRPTLVLYSQSGKTSYRHISLSFEIATLYALMLASFSNLTGISAVLLSMCLSNYRAIGKVQTRISGLRDFMRSCGKTSYRLVNRGPVDVSLIPPLVIVIEHRWYKMKARRNHPQLRIKYTVWLHFDWSVQIQCEIRYFKQCHLAFK